MKVRKEPEERPDIVITVSWREAEILLSMCENTGGLGEGRAVTDNLSIALDSVGVCYDPAVRFDGVFKVSVKHG